MVIKDLLKETTAMVCGRIDSKENTVEKMYGIMKYNKDVIEQCSYVVLVLNRSSDVSESDMSEIYNFYKQEFENVFILQPHPIGMGNQIGHVCLDKTGYLFSKNNLCTKYTMKISGDVLVEKRIMDVEINDADFYFIPGVGLNEAIGKWPEMVQEYKLTKGYNNVFLTYQTFFYITSNKPSYIFESDEDMEKIFRKWDHRKDPRQEGLLCVEHSLVRWSIANNLTRFPLYNPEQFENYRKFVVDNRVFDGSLKNVYLHPIGITHFHFGNEPVMQFDM